MLPKLSDSSKYFEIHLGQWMAMSMETEELELQEISSVQPSGHTAKEKHPDISPPPPLASTAMRPRQRDPETGLPPPSPLLSGMDNTAAHTHQTSILLITKSVQFKSLTLLMHYISDIAVSNQ